MPTTGGTLATKQGQLTDLSSSLDQIQLLAEEVQPIVSEAGDRPTLTQAMQIASAMDRMRTLLTEPLLEATARLQNTTLGFLTDKPEGYATKVLRDVMIEATLRGFLPVNNEFNIIAGRFYAAKNGLRRKIVTWPGLTDLRIELGVPKVSEGGALCPVYASWKLNGIKDELNCLEEGRQIPVRRNAGMGVDGLLGKAERKAYARILNRISGSLITVEEQETETADSFPETVGELPQPDDLSSRLAAATTEQEVEKIRADALEDAKGEQEARIRAKCTARMMELIGE
jgi:hypothetical protein